MVLGRTQIERRGEHVASVRSATPPLVSVMAPVFTLVKLPSCAAVSETAPSDSSRSTSALTRSDDMLIASAVSRSRMSTPTPPL